MIDNSQTVINVLPKVGNVIQLHSTVILSNDGSFVEADITQIQLEYGTGKINGDTFTPLLPVPAALRIHATYSGTDYASYIYMEPILGNKTPNNFERLSQKYPLGVFKAIIPGETIVGSLTKATSEMIDDYYQEYFNVVNQVYFFTYSPDLEFEYNGSIGLLSISFDPVRLFLLFSSLSSVSLTGYDLELCVSKYIYYRLGIISAVYINEHILNPDDYWNLGIPGLTELDSTTRLAPNNFISPVKNLNWKIFNASTFTPDFKEEVTAFIHRISRADIGNFVMYSHIVDPQSDNFSLVGATYPDDKRTFYGRCLQYIGEDAFPLNVIGYTKIFT